VNAHDRYDELAVGHALNALEPEDEVEFLAHLRSCAACTQAVAEHRETLGHLAYAVASEEPPPALLAGIRAGVEASGRAGDFPAPVTSLDERRRARTVKLTTALVGVAASVVLVVALLITNLNLSSRNHDLHKQDLAFQQTVSSLLTSGAQRVELAPQAGTGKVVAVVHNGQVDLVLSDVMANDPANSTYVLWQQTEHGVSAAGTFDVRHDGVTVVNTGLHVSPAGLEQLMITKEAGRSAPPTARNSVLFAGSA
jgi:anti-sigma-K factor RskA